MCQQLWNTFLSQRDDVPAIVEQLLSEILVAGTAARLGHKPLIPGVASEKSSPTRIALWPQKPLNEQSEVFGNC
jgi:hypothetical protein